MNRASDHRGAIIGVLAASTAWGVFWGGWAALLPLVKQEQSIGDAELGLALLAIPAGALLAMGLARQAPDAAQFKLLQVSLGAFAVGILGLAAATSLPVFVAAMFLVGAGSGAIEVSLNAATAVLEAAGRRLFQLVHSLTPLAMVVTAPLVGITRESVNDTAPILIAMAATVVAAAVVVRTPATLDRATSRTADVGVRGAALTAAPALLLLAGCAALVLLMENAVEQWGALLLEEEQGARPAVSSLAPTSYMAALFVGRSIAQAATWLPGPAPLAAVGGVGGALGMLLATSVSSPLWSLVGFAVAGLCLAPLLPAILSAVAKEQAAGARGRAVGLVTMVGYAGFLISPAVIGLSAAAIGLPSALQLASLCGVLIVVMGLSGAHSLSTRSRSARSPR